MIINNIKEKINAKLIYGTVVTILVLYSVVFSSIGVFLSSKIGYIDTAVLLEKYPGALKAREEIEKRSGEWKNNIQILEIELDSLNAEILKNSQKWSKEELKSKNDIMKRKHADYAKYAKAINEKAVQLQQEAFAPVYSELNFKIEEFGKSRKYDIILGTVNGGNILYANKNNDLTEEFLKYVKN